MPVPPFKASNWPRGAVIWFKDDAGEPIKRIWEIASLLKQHGVPVRMLRSVNPGKVLYEDSFQVVVEEWKNAGIYKAFTGAKHLFKSTTCILAL